MSKKSSEVRVLRAETRFSVVPEWVVYADISAHAVRVYATLARYADAEGSCFPARATIAERCRVSVPTIERALRELVDIGALVVENRFDDRGQQQSSIYTLTSANARGVITGEDPGVITGDGGGSSPVMHRRRTIEREPERTSVVSDSGAAKARSAADVERDEHAVRLANLLADLMVENGCKRPTVTARWVDAIERLIRIDEKTPEQVERAIRWAQADEFWRGNILSPEKLRKQYDALRLAAMRQRGATGATAGVDVDAGWAEVQRAISRVGRNGRPLDEDWSSAEVCAAVKSIGWFELCGMDEFTARRSVTAALRGTPPSGDPGVRVAG